MTETYLQRVVCDFKYTFCDEIKRKMSASAKKFKIVPMLKQYLLWEKENTCSFPCNFKCKIQYRKNMCNTLKI